MIQDVLHRLLLIAFLMTCWQANDAEMAQETIKLPSHP
jgi:hypothetical protein